MSIFQAIGDGANKLVNSATFGLFNRAIGAATGNSDRVDAYNQEVSQRLGRVGDVIEGGATLLPIARAAQGFQQLARLVRPVAAEAAPILGTVARIRAAPVRYGAGGVALTGMAGGRRSLVDEAQAAAPGGAAGGGVAVPAANRPALSDWELRGQRAQAALDARAAVPVPAMTPFQRTLQSFGANSGGISLNELAVLAQAENQGRPAPTRAARTPTGRDVAAGQIISMADQMFEARAAQAEQLARTDPTAGARAYQSAVAERMAALQGILGQNPINEAVGRGMRQDDDEE